MFYLDLNYDMIHYLVYNKISEFKEYPWEQDNPNNRNHSKGEKNQSRRRDEMKSGLSYVLSATKISFLSM